MERKLDEVEKWKIEVIYPATFNEHLNGWHGGNVCNSMSGELIKTIIDF